MEIKSKDELNSTLDEIMARLSIVEQSTTEKPKNNDKTPDEPKDKTPKVESVDEIEKLLSN